VLDDASGQGARKALKPAAGDPSHDVSAPKAPRGKRSGKARDMTWTVYSSLRESILNGAIAPGASLSQVQLANKLGVSRGPLREAVRMLQREGLVEAEVNRRGRVSSFSIDDLEQLYAMRIVHEALALRINVPKFTKADLNTLRGHLQRMDELADHDLKQWQVVDRELHFALVAHTSGRMLRTIHELYDHADRYRWLYIKGVPRALSIAASEHKRIVDACADGDPVEASAELARHLARTALTVMTHHAPEHDPTTVRAAVRLATGVEVSVADGPPPSPGPKAFRRR
jgi:DNA-binding GntR family transcriptional regulator